MRRSVTAVVVGLALAIGATACGGSSAPRPADHPSSSVRLPSYIVKSVNAGQKPCAVEGGFGSIWVSDYTDNLELRFDPTTLRVLARIKVGISPCGIAVGGGSVWVENFGDGTVSRIDPETNKVKTIRVGTSPYDVTYLAGAAWVTNYGDNTVSRIDARTNKTQTIKVGQSPTGVGPGGGAVWVTNGLDGTISRIDPASLKVRTTHVGSMPSWTAWGEGRLWISDGRLLDRIALTGPSAGRVDKRVALHAGLNDGDVSGGTVWVSDSSGGLHAVDAATGKVLGSWDLHLVNPFVLATYAGHLWVVDFLGTQLEELDPTALTGG
jgi:YVTN family beta-propeller protein